MSNIMLLTHNSSYMVMKILCSKRKDNQKTKIILDYLYNLVFLYYIL